MAGRNRDRPRNDTFYTRRSLIHGALAGGTGLTGAALLACSSGASRNSARSQGAGGGAAKPQTGGTLNWPQTGQIPTLDPTVHTGSGANDAEYACLSTLFRFKIGPDPKTSEDHNVEGYVATSAESPDALTWTVKLRHDVKFHDIAPVNGHPLEAEDVKASYTRSLTLPASAIKGSLGMINANQIETPDPTTVVFKLNYPYAPFTHTLASPNYSQLFPREALAGSYDLAKQVIGSGPFIWANYTPDVAITLKKNPAYLEQGRPYIDGVQLPIILDAAQQLSQFTAGHLDCLTVVQQNLETAKRENPKARVLTGTNGGNLTIFFQLGSEAAIFQDIRLRRAISMAIDRDAIGKVLYEGQYTPAFAVKTFMGKWALTMDELNPSVRPYYQFDLDGAKKLFAEAGGSRLDVRLAYYIGGGGADPSYVKASQMMFNMLQSLPWKSINLVSIDFTKDWIGGGKGWRYGNIPNDVILVAGLQPYGEVDEYVFDLFGSKSTENHEHLEDPKLDAMIAQARTIVDEEQRRKAYLDVQQYIASQMYNVGGLPAGNDHTFLQPWVQNFNYTFSDEERRDVWSSLWLQK